MRVGDRSMRVTGFATRGAGSAGRCRPRSGSGRRGRSIARTPRRRPSATREVRSNRRPARPARRRAAAASSAPTRRRLDGLGARDDRVAEALGEQLVERRVLEVVAGEARREVVGTCRSSTAIGIVVGEPEPADVQHRGAGWHLEQRGQHRPPAGVAASRQYGCPDAAPGRACRRRTRWPRAAGTPSPSRRTCPTPAGAPAGCSATTRRSPGAASSGRRRARGRVGAQPASGFTGGQSLDQQLQTPRGSVAASRSPLPAVRRSPADHDLRRPALAVRAVQRGDHVGDAVVGVFGVEPSRCHGRWRPGGWRRAGRTVVASRGRCERRRTTILRRARTAGRRLRGGPRRAW